MRHLHELIALIPPSMRPPGERPRLDCSAAPSVDADGGDRHVIHELGLLVPEVGDLASRAAIEAILSHPHTAAVRKLTIARSFEAWPRPADLDFGWVLATLADLGRPAQLTSLFVTEQGPTVMDAVGRFASRPRALTTYNSLTRFGAGLFPGVEILDLRDSDVEWACEPNAFPDLTTLILRPRGPGRIGAGWAKALFDRPEVFPHLRELRGPEGHGDQLLELLLDAPALAGRLGVLDFTNALTNRGAMLLCEGAPLLANVEELWVATTSERRDGLTRMARDAKSATELPPLGQLEITDDWRNRLRQRFGRRLRLATRPSHPGL
ncbi:MAG TPA: hypothetical protein VLT33_27980 [Labilithrix sp.]|nr:hypothetical protein [Labilithrix sp.]